MKLTKTVTIGPRAIEVRELTVADIRAWLISLESAEAEFDLVDAALIDGASLADLAVMADLTPAEIEALTPSELRRVFDACREVNADFFTLRGKLEAIGRQALALPDATSNEPPAP